MDLLVSGERLPPLEPWKADTCYCAIVSRAGRRPQAELFEWPLSHPLPRISVPLKPGDPDAVLDLQRALNAVYDGAGYDYALRYDRTLELPLSSAEANWVESIVANGRSL